MCSASDAVARQALNARIIAILKINADVANSSSLGFTMLLLVTVMVLTGLTGVLHRAPAVRISRAMRPGDGKEKERRSRGTIRRRTIP